MSELTPQEKFDAVLNHKLGQLSVAIVAAACEMGITLDDTGSESLIRFIHELPKHAPLPPPEPMPIEVKEKPVGLHWYSFVFQTTLPTGVVQTQSIYMGYPHQQISVGLVQDAKRACGMPPTSVLLSLSYMGHMLRDEMTTEQSWSHNEQKLVDTAFELVSVSHERYEYFAGLTQEQRMEWVAKQLRTCGFPTTPIGMSWGVLDKIREN